MITVQPIRYTSQPDAWHALAHALGFAAAFPPGSDWSEFDANGVLAIHRAEPGAAEDGRSDLHLLADDLDRVKARLTTAGFGVTRTILADVGPMLTVTASSGARVTVSGGARSTAGGALSVQPIWYQAELGEPRRILEAIGLAPRLASDSGDWLAFAADGGGQAALHRGDSVRFELSLEYTGDLDALARDLIRAGYSAVVVDEAYNRTLLVATPDGDQLWVNGVVDDLHGYSRPGSR